VGRYILDPSVFGYLRKIPAGAGGEIQLTDGIAAMLGTHPVLALAFEGERYDCGSRQGFIRATIDYALEDDGLREDVLDHMFELLRNSGRI
jgi:UTP--glucose-1-phosphate uridylyltransferase